MGDTSLREALVKRTAPRLNTGNAQFTHEAFTQLESPLIHRASGRIRVHDGSNPSQRGPRLSTRGLSRLS